MKLYPRWKPPNRWRWWLWSDPRRVVDLLVVAADCQRSILAACIVVHLCHELLRILLPTRHRGHCGDDLASLSHVERPTRERRVWWNVWKKWRQRTRCIFGRQGHSVRGQNVCGEWFTLSRAIEGGMAAHSADRLQVEQLVAVI